MKDKEYCIKFITNELEKALKLDKEITEEINKEKQAIYTVEIEGVDANYKGVIMIRENNKEE